MVKKIVAVSLCVMLGNTLYAREVSQNEKIIGIEVGYGTIQADNQFSPVIGELDHVASDVQFGFRIGAQQKEWRTLLVADYFNSTDDDQQYIKGFLELDYFVIQDSALKPFIGANVGYMNYQTTAIDESGLLYGGQAGVSYRVSDAVDMDVMYRYSFSTANSTNHIEGIIFGLNYIY